VALTNAQIVARIDYMAPMLARARERAAAGEPLGRIWPELDGCARRAQDLCDAIVEEVLTQLPLPGREP